MTDLLTAPAEPDIRPAGPAARPARRRFWVVAAAGLLAVLAIAAVLASRSAVDGVIVYQDAEPLVCEGEEVFPYSQDDAAGLAVPTVVLAEGMGCTLRVHLRNEGWADVTIDAVRLAMMGDFAQVDLDPVSVRPNGSSPRTVDDDDALVPLTEVHLAPGQTMLLESRFRYGGDAVLDDCSSLSWSPTIVEFSAFGASRAVNAPLDVRFALQDPRECAL